MFEYIYWPLICVAILSLISTLGEAHFTTIPDPSVVDGLEVETDQSCVGIIAYVNI